MTHQLGVRAERKLQLILAGEQEIAVVGLASASVVSIAKRAGNTNRSAVKYYFDDLDDLIASICQYRFQALSGLRAHMERWFDENIDYPSPEEEGYWMVLATVVTYMQGMVSELPQSYVMRFFRAYVHTTGDMFTDKEVEWLHSFQDAVARIVGLLRAVFSGAKGVAEAAHRLGVAGSCIVGYMSDTEAALARTGKTLSDAEMLERAVALCEFMCAGLFNRSFTHLRGKHDDIVLQALSDYGELDFKEAALRAGLL